MLTSSRTADTLAGTGPPVTLTLSTCLLATDVLALTRLVASATNPPAAGVVFAAGVSIGASGGCDDTPVMPRVSSALIANSGVTGMRVARAAGARHGRMILEWRGTNVPPVRAGPDRLVAR